MLYTLDNHVEFVSYKTDLLRKIMNFIAKNDKIWSISLYSCLYKVGLSIVHFHKNAFLFKGYNSAKNHATIKPIKCAQEHEVPLNPSFVHSLICKMPKICTTRNGTDHSFSLDEITPPVSEE